jgi:hypothetical protein
VKNAWFLLMLAALALWNEHTRAQEYVCCASLHSDSHCISGDSQCCCTEPNHPYPDCGFVWGLTFSGNIGTDPNPCNSEYANVNNNCAQWLPGGSAPKKQPAKNVENKSPASEKKQK